MKNKTNRTAKINFKNEDIVVNIELYDDSKKEELNIVRVVWRNDLNQRCTSFINSNDVKLF